MNYRHLISVIIPVYNAENFIQRAIKSALLQEVGEIIVIDDKYPDDAIKIVRQMQKADKRIRIFEHPDTKNHGASAARNLGISVAKCKYLAFLDADDYYLPNRFYKQLNFLESHPEYDGCYGKLGYTIDTSISNNLKPVNAKETGIDRDVPSEELLFVLLSGKYGSIHVGDTMLFRKKIFNHIDAFDVRFELSQDIEFLLRASFKFHFKNCPLDEIIAVRQVHAQNRVHDNQKRVFYSRLLNKDASYWLWHRGMNNHQLKIIANAYFSSITNYYIYKKNHSHVSWYTIKYEYWKDLIFFIRNNFKISLLRTYIIWLKYYFFKG